MAAYAGRVTGAGGVFGLRAVDRVTIVALHTSFRQALPKHCHRAVSNHWTFTMGNGIVRTLQGKEHSVTTGEHGNSMARAEQDFSIAVTTAKHGNGPTRATTQCRKRARCRPQASIDAWHAQMYWANVHGWPEHGQTMARSWP